MFQKKKSQLRFVSLEERIVFDASGVIFVDATVAAGGDGSSWSQAYNNLDSALAAASATAGADQIWIADGTYKPSGGSNTSTFDLPDDVQLYGGFKGNESSLQSRNPVKNITILSGDLNGDDVQGNAMTMDDNSWHVVTASGVTVLLDGLYVKGGNAVGPAHPDDQGGGLYATAGADVTLNKMVFKENAADYNGGGIHVENFSTLSLTNSLLTKNFQTSPIIDALHGGGALSGVIGSTINISNSIFYDNFAGEDGGAIRFQSANANISNSAFIDNHSAASGGAIASLDLFSIGLTTNINIDNTLFLNNKGTYFGGGVFISQIIGDSESFVHISNSNFIQNEGADFGGGLYMGNRDALIENSNFIGNTAQTVGGGLTVEGAANAFFGQPGNTVTVNDSNFINNTVLGDNPGALDVTGFFPGTSFVSGVQGGGAIGQLGEITLLVDNTDFINNRVLQDGDGGAILVGGLILLNADSSILAPGNTTVITDSNFVNNRALDGNGGAIAAESVIPYTTPGAPTLTLSGSTFKSNDASATGGALYLTDYTTSITSNVFYKSNDADMLGDQVYAKDTLLNGVDSGAPGAKAALTSVNQFKNLDNDDRYLI